MIERECEVLQCLGVVVVGEELNAGPVVGPQTEVGSQTAVVAQEDVVAVVCRKPLVSQDGLTAQDAEPYTTVFHRGA